MRAPVCLLRSKDATRILEHLANRELEAAWGMDVGGNGTAPAGRVVGADHPLLRQLHPHHRPRLQLACMERQLYHGRDECCFRSDDSFRYWQLGLRGACNEYKRLFGGSWHYHSVRRGGIRHCRSRKHYGFRQRSICGADVHNRAKSIPQEWMYMDTARQLRDDDPDEC